MIPTVHAVSPFGTYLRLSLIIKIHSIQGSVQTSDSHSVTGDIYSQKLTHPIHFPEVRDIY